MYMSWEEINGVSHSGIYDGLYIANFYSLCLFICLQFDFIMRLLLSCIETQHILFVQYTQSWKEYHFFVEIVVAIVWT